jgi:hypothetical protein
LSPLEKNQAEIVRESRLNFIFAAAVFSAVYLVCFYQVEISFGGFLILGTVLFSIFCYTLELERIGRALVEPKDRNGAGDEYRARR